MKMKKRLFEEDPQLAQNILANSHSEKKAIPIIELDFGIWSDLDPSAKQAVIGYTARFCGNVFKAFVSDAINRQKGLGNFRLGQEAIEQALDAIERQIRVDIKILGGNPSGN